MVENRHKKKAFSTSHHALAYFQFEISSTTSVSYVVEHCKQISIELLEFQVEPSSWAAHRHQHQLATLLVFAQPILTENEQAAEA